MNARPRLGTPGIVLLVAAGLAVGADAPSRAVSLAAAKKLLVSAKQDPALASLSQKAFEIATDLERQSAEIDRLRSLKVAKSDPVFKGLIQGVEAARVQLLALQQKVKLADGSGQTKQSSGQTKQSQGETKKGAEDSQTSRDRRRAAQDGIQKMLDIIRSMNPQI